MDAEVTQVEPGKWIWRCSKCEGPDSMTNCANVTIVGDIECSDFEKRYEQPALAALAEKARLHNVTHHPEAV